MVNIFFIVQDFQQIFSEFPEILPGKHFSQKSWNSSWLVKKSRDFSGDITFGENTSKLHIILKKVRLWFLYFNIILLIDLSINNQKWKFPNIHLNITVYSEKAKKWPIFMKSHSVLKSLELLKCQWYCNIFIINNQVMTRKDCLDEKKAESNNSNGPTDHSNQIPQKWQVWEFICAQVM